MAQRGSDFDSVKTNSRPEKSQPSDKVTVFKFPPKKWITFRCAGPIHSYATGWIKTKKKDGKSVKFPVVMPSYDPETQQFDSTIYDPWYGVWQGQKDVDREDQLVQLSTKYYTNMICRSVQKQMPGTLVKATSGERKSGFKDKDSDTWTPWVAVSLPAGAIAKIKDLKGTNVVESAKTGNSKAYSVADAKYGCDIRIMYDPDKSPAEQYSVQTTNKRTPITEEEQAFLRWDTSDLASPMTKEETKTEFDNWSKRMGIKVGKKAKPEIDEDEDIDSDYEDDELDDEEPVSKKKVAKKPASKSKKKVEEDEDEDFDDSESEDFDDSDSDDDSDFDDEEEDEPAPKKKVSAKPAAKGKKKVVEEDDEDFDDDDSEADDSDEDDEDFDDEPAPKKKAPAKKPVAKGKKKVEEDEDEDFDDEDESDSDSDDGDDSDDDFDDEDDEPAPSPKKKAPVKKPVAKTTPPKSKRKPVVEDDEDEDFDDSDSDDDSDFDDEEEDEPAPRRKAPAKPVAKKVKR